MYSWHERTQISLRSMLKTLALHPSKFYQWKIREGKDNQHNGKQPKDFWITEDEKRTVIEYYQSHHQEGYRAVTYMMIDEDIAYMSCSSVYRILSDVGLMRTKTTKKSSKGNGFEQPLQAHEHWHTDISYVKINKRFYFFIGVLDGYSRCLLHWEIRESMDEQDAEIVVKRSLEKFPEARPRIITDNGSQYTGQEFKKFIAIHGLTHVRTSPYYPQSNGKLERFHYTLKEGSIRPKVPLSVEDARRVVTQYVEYYNNTRLHSSIGFITPSDKLIGKDVSIIQERKRKLAEAKIRRLEFFAEAS
ncbi:IS3 family transposase [Lentisphaera marina]|uniref:IS3 family transposase n=1 Tax=Lentisphaera marina TaxID=1111041 RepID=UPI002365846D|nr:IS3 family transposase [Lentisphaera marina]MDD7983568.1 IS3 family transposase [Lentisphaera marina]MDD7984968.1 IS3 family transposase [Lentisphaera marina]MDD7985231.1 IS3 family transposase [Lentisphaera marina]MDD7985365.1 IS3 family transposase [Lentisphaera marina]MDD7986467.1 IS3 family transposase [Lentisphaera marina]